MYRAFKKKFITLIPEEPKNAYLFFYEYYYHGLKRFINKIILLTTNDSKISGFIVLEGLGIPIISFNPPIKVLVNTYRRLGLKSLFRLIIGILLIEGYPPSNKYLYINTVIVNPKYRRKKIGLKLMKLAENIARKQQKKGLCLYVSKSNFPALKLYKKLGYESEGGFGNKFLENLIGVKRYIYLLKRF